LATLILDLFSAKFWELVFDKERNVVECYEFGSGGLCSAYDELNKFLIDRLKDAIDQYFKNQDFSALLSVVEEVEEKAQEVFKISLKLIPEIYLDEEGEPAEVVIIITIDWSTIKDKTLEEAISEYLKQIQVVQTHQP